MIGGSVLFATLLATSAVRAEGLATEVRFVPLTPIEKKSLDRLRRRARRQVLADRAVYWDDDGYAQMLALFFGDEAASRVELELAREGRVVAKQTIEASGDPSPKIRFLVDMRPLAAGAYTLSATLLDRDGRALSKAVPATFGREARSRKKIPIPAGGLALSLYPRPAPSPMTIGVPMPHGTLLRTDALHLFEDGKEIPAQWTVRQTWGPGADASIRWLSLDFLARPDRGYRIRSSSQQASAGAAMRVEDGQDRIRIETGAITFEISKARFTGIDAAWIGGRQVIDASTSLAGPYVLGEDGAIYSVEGSEVSVEETGPLRTTVVARGRFARSGKQMGLFITRITGYAGLSRIDISHRFVFTFDTRQQKLADVGFRVPTSPASRWIAGTDGKVVSGDVRAHPVFVHQERSDCVRVVVEDAPDLSIAGRRSDGWIGLELDGISVAGAMRDVWQKFPKELEADDAGLTFHLWPRHGRKVFSDEESLSRGHIYQLRWAHEGALLDLALPPSYVDALHRFDVAEKWDREGTIAKAAVSTSEGVAMSADLSLIFDRTDRLATQASAFVEKPHGVVDPVWTEATLALGPWAARREDRYPEIERMLEAYPKILASLEESTAEYGMWIRGNVHNHWDPRKNQAALHRVWQNSHYQNVGLGWLLYARSGSRAMLERARAQTDNFMDVGTVNYADPIDPPMFHLPGAMHHVKAFLPWGTMARDMKVRDADAGVMGHWIDPDAFLYRYLLEGDLRARDLYRMWASSFNEKRVGTVAGREATNTFAMTLNYYEATWDPQAILYNYGFAEGALEIPFEKYQVPRWFPVWHPGWMERYYALTRDPRIVDHAKRYVEAGFGRPAVDAFVHRRTGDASVLQKRAGQVYESTRKVYYRTADPLDGYGLHVHAVYTRWLAELPIYLSALRSAGIDSIRDLASAPSYPASSSHFSKGDGRSEVGLRVLALDPNDRAFAVNVKGAKGNPIQVFVIAPSGKIVEKIERSKDPITRQIARDDERGAYVIEVQGYRPVLGAPVTTLPAEVAVIAKGQEVWSGLRTVGVLVLPPKRKATITFSVDRKLPRVTPSWVNLRDQRGRVVVETSLLAGSQRESVSASLESDASIGIWSIEVRSSLDVQMSWTGDGDDLYFARTAKEAEALLRAISPTRR